MNEKDIAEFLKRLRKASNLTLKEVEKRIKALGYHISHKTISGYENGRSVPNADVFLALCEIYGSENPIEDLKEMNRQSVKSYFTLTSLEEEHLEKYRSLDHHGKKAVDTLLTLESERLNEYQNSQQKKKIRVGAEFASDTLIAASGAENLTEEERDAFEEDLKRVDDFIGNLEDSDDSV